ncbi:MAG: hypothetical protein IJS96_02275 [Schwartzia sp.]|nr:hypothetical protein [Schwartzia sp. (in: firmicutes)]
MQKNILAKRIAAGFLAGLTAASLLAGCGGGGGDKGSGAANNPPKAETPAQPARATVATAPSETFKIGDNEVKAYELTGVDLKDKLRTWGLATIGDSVYFHIGVKPQHMAKVTVKNETLSDFTDLGEAGDVNAMASNGKVVIWKTKDSKAAIHDGKETKIGGKWPGDLAGIPGSDEFYVLRGGLLKVMKLENGEFKDVREISPDIRAKDLADTRLSLVYGDKDTIYARCVLNKAGETKGTPVLVAFGTDGKEIRRYEGPAGGKRDFCVTESYVVYAGADGNIRVFDKKSGKTLGDAKVNFGPFALRAKTGNDVLAYDDRGKKLYRIDF